MKSMNHFFCHIFVVGNSMKLSVLVTAFVLMANMASANTFTVSNDNSGGAQFSSLQGGLNACSASGGDTLLLEGTNINYSFSGSWSKPVVVIGIGFNPNKTNPKRSIIQINGLAIVNSGSASKFYGIEFNQGFVLSQAVGDLAFEDCLFDALFNINNNYAINFTFKNCIFSSCPTCNRNTGNFNLALDGIQNLNFLFTNCIFDGWIEGQLNTVSTVICLILGLTGLKGTHAVSSFSSGNRSCKA